MRVSGVLGVHKGSCSSVADAVQNVYVTGDCNPSNILPCSVYFCTAQSCGLVRSDAASLFAGTLSLIFKGREVHLFVELLTLE